MLLRFKSVSQCLGPDIPQRCSVAVGGSPILQRVVQVNCPWDPVLWGSHQMVCVCVSCVAQHPGMGVFLKVRMRTHCVHFCFPPETPRGDQVGS